MTKNTIIVREFPGGGPASGEDYDILLEADDSTLASGTTGVDGSITYSPNGSPGPWRWEVDTGTTIRKGSSKHAGSGGSYSLAEIPIALRAIGTGVIDGYLEEMLAEDTGAAKAIRINTGAILVNGIVAVWNADETYTVVSSTDASNPRACYVGVVVTGVDEPYAGMATIGELCGTAAASPALPSLTSSQTEASWFEPLATFRLGITGASAPDSITNMTDVRRFALTRNAILSAAAYRTDTSTPQTTNSSTGVDVTWSSGSTNLTLTSGVTYDVRAEVFLLVQAPSGQTISIAPYINGTGNIATYIPSAISTSYTGISNVYTLNGVLGTGAAITNGVRVKISGGVPTGSVLTGSALFQATPRS